jgi:hypothetical protein
MKGSMSLVPCAVIVLDLLTLAAIIVVAIAIVF